MALVSRGPGPPVWALFGIILLLLLLSAGRVTSEKNKYYHMSSQCKNHFLTLQYRKIDGAVLQSQNERNLDCVITFQTHSILQRFMLRFDLLQLDCNDHLFIYDGAHAVGSYKSDLSCRNTKQTVGAIYTRTNFVTLKYVTDGWGTESNGFKLVITAFKDKKLACEDFRCNREFCIHTDLVCDDVNHCGDDSDELNSALCTPSELGTVLGMNSLVFVVVIVSSVLVLCAGAVALAVCLCRSSRHHGRPPHLQSTQQQPPNASFPLQQMYGSNGAGTLTSCTVVKPLPPPGNWLHPAGLRLGYSAARVRLYCQAKSGAPAPTATFPPVKRTNGSCRG